MADRTVVYRLRAEIGQLKAQMAAAGASFRKAADDATALNKEGEKTRRGLDALGGAAGKVGLVAAAGLGAAVLKAANFDQAMSSVQAATHESAAGMEDLRQAALDAGAQTAFSATEAAAGIENLAKAGVTTQEILDGGLNGALALAAAGEMDVAAAAEAAAGAMAQFKLEGADVPHIADLLSAASGKAQGEVSDMVMALKQGGTVASQTGLSLEETTGTLAALAEQSLLGSDAGTAFKTMLSSLTPNSAKAAKAMETYNIQAFDAQGNFVGMTELAGQLESGLGHLTEEQRAMALETIFGSDAVRAAAIVYDNGAEGIANWTAKVNDAGYAAETAAIKQDNLRGDLEKLGGALETALIGTGSGAQGPLRSLTQSLESVVNAYNDLGEGAKSGVGKVLAATALLGGGAFVFSKMVQGIANTRQALADLGVEAGRTKGLMAGIGKGLQFGALLLLIPELERQLDNLFDTRLDDSALSRDLESLAGGRTVGEMEKLASWISILDDNMSEFTQTAFGKLPGTDALSVAEQELSKIDAALASMVESGNAGQAAAAMAQIEAIAREQGTSVNQLTEIFTEYDQAVQNAAPPTRSFLDVVGEAAGALSGLATGEGRFADAARRATALTEAQAQALKEAREQARETGGAFFGLGEKVDKAGVSLGQWLRDLQKQAAALEEFTANARRAARRGLDEGLIASLEAAGPAGALRMRQLANATDAELGRANEAWRRGERAIDDYVDSTTKVPKDKSTKVTANTDQAMLGIRGVESALNSIADETVFINVMRRRSYEGGGLGAVGSASGGTVPKTGLGYADRFPYLLADGEEVISNRFGQADRHRDLLKAINANRLADGGTVQHRYETRHAVPAMGGGGTRVVERVVERLPAGKVVAHIEGFGEVAMRFTDDRIAAHATYRDATGPRHRRRR